MILDTSPVPYWRRTAIRASAWETRLRAGDFVVNAVRFGIWDPPSVPFVAGKGRILEDLPHSVEDRQFANQALEEGISGSIFEKVTKQFAENLVRTKGVLVSNSFVVWKGDGEERKPRPVINFKVQSTHWPKGPVRLETLEMFAEDLHQGDHLITMDIKSGYHQFRIYPKMRNWFLFRNGGQFFRCIALPFGWGRSGWWFCRILRPFVRTIPELGHRMLSWIDDFAAAATQSQATKEKALEASKQLQELMDDLGLTRHPEKGAWGTGSTSVECLGVIIDTMEMTYSLPECKIKKMHSLAKSLLAEAAKNRRWVSEARLSTVCGVAASFSLPYPLAAFHSRGINCDLHRKLPRQREGKARLSRTGMKDLQHWRSFTRSTGRPIHHPLPQRAMHSDASDLGYGGTWSTDLEQGLAGDCEGQGLWSATDRQATISVRELRAVRLLSHGHFASLARDWDVRNVLLWEDNSAVVSSLNKMVSKSPAMMSELRKLHGILHKLGVHIQAKWIPSAVNRYADRLSRTWNIRDVTLTSKLVEELAAAYRLSPVHFRYPPPSPLPHGGPPSCPETAGTSTTSTRLGRWNSQTVEPSPGTNSSRSAEDKIRWGRRYPSCSELESTTLVEPHLALRRSSDSDLILLPTTRRKLDETRTTTIRERVEHRSRPVLSGRARRLHRLIFDGILPVARMGSSGRGRSAAQLICDHFWADSTLETRAGQWERWLAFCDEEDREPLPATRADITAYLGYLHNTGQVGARSWEQYVSAVSMIHIFHGHPSPSRGEPLVDEVIKAGLKEESSRSSERLQRGGLPASIAHAICISGLNSTSAVDIRKSAIITLGYCLGAREDTLRHMAIDDVNVDGLRIDAKLIYRKGKPRSEPLHIRYTRWVNHGPNNPLTLLRRWLIIRYSYHTSSCENAPGNLWFLPDQNSVMREQSLTGILRRFVARVGHTPHPGYFYSSHSIRIGASTTMQLLYIQDSRVVRHLGWNSAIYLQIYFYYTHRLYESCKWFFAQFI